MIQWHPIFAALLRPMLELYYEIRTNVPVGDLPRAAGIGLLRRLGAAAPPFGGRWRLWTPWNVVDFKGPTVSARVDDLDRLMELGLGIRRRLNELRTREQPARLRRDEVSFWYVANRLGKRWLKGAAQLLGRL